MITIGLSQPRRYLMNKNKVIQFADVPTNVFDKVPTNLSKTGVH